MMLILRWRLDRACTCAGLFVVLVGLHVVLISGVEWSSEWLKKDRGRKRANWFAWAHTPWALGEQGFGADFIVVKGLFSVGYGQNLRSGKTTKQR